MRQFVLKAAPFVEIDTSLTAFGTALDRVKENAGNVIFLAGEGGNYAVVDSTLATAPAGLSVDDDIVVTSGAHRHGTSASEHQREFGRGSALPMWQGVN